MRLNVFLFLSIGFLLVSCHHDPYVVNPLFTYADSVMEDHPDSALNYLRKLDVSEFSDADKAYYGLLLAQATDKNYLPLLPCDSLVDAALNYYDEGDGLLRAKALLYKGRIQQAMKMPEEAMANYYAGLSELGDTPPELRLKSMLYDDLGEIYQEQLLDRKALEMYQRSYQGDSLLNDEKLLKYSIASIGWAHVMLDHEDIADMYLDRALKLGIRQNDSIFISNIYKHKNLNCQNLDSALVYLRLAQRYWTDKVDSIGLLLAFGELFLERDELDSADCYLRKTLACADLERNVNAHRLLSNLENKKENYQAAYNYSMFYQDNVDSIFALTQNSEIERLAYKYESEMKVIKEKAKTERIVQYAISSFLILFLSSFLIIQRIHRRKKLAKLLYEQTISHLNKQIALHQVNIEKSKEELLLLQHAQQKNNEEIFLKEQDIRRMIDEKAALRNWFFMQTPVYKRIEALAQQNSVGREAEVLLQSEQLLLKETIFQIYDEYVQYLQSTYPKLTEDDCVYCCLLLCRLNDQTIAYCFGNTSKQVIAQRRLRLKKKMETAS